MRKFILSVLLMSLCSTGFAKIDLPDVIDFDLPPVVLPYVNVCTSLPVLNNFNITVYDCNSGRIWMSLEAKDHSYVLDFVLFNGVVQTWCRSKDRAVCYALGSKEDCRDTRGWNWCYFGDPDILKYPQNEVSYEEVE